MTTTSREFVAVALTSDEARVWSAGHVEVGAIPDRIDAHDGRRLGASGVGAREPRADVDQERAQYFESIADAVAGAHQILLMGRDSDESAMWSLEGFWEARHPDLARRVVAMVDSDPDRLSEAQMLVIVREWFEDFI